MTYTGGRRIVKTKAKGARSEYKVRDQLLADGWYVTKAGGSFGLWDLVALHPDGSIRLVQVKTNKAPGSDEMMKMKEFGSKFTKCSCSIAIVADRQPVKWIWL